MPDVYLTITEADREVQERLADVLELRAADPQQRAMLDAYLGELAPPEGARVLEIGCGTGAVGRVLAAQGFAVSGVDPSPVFIERAAAAAPEIAFAVGDAHALPYPDGSFDAAVMHTVLCHVRDPALVLREARRVVVPGGSLAVFDGDYATASVAIGPSDPLQSCAEATVEALVHDPWIVRRLGALVRDAGWDPGPLRYHGYVETATPGYTLTVVDRGADALAAAGRIGDELAEALKAEARRRVDAGAFHGFVGYASMVATRPA